MATEPRPMHLPCARGGPAGWWFRPVFGAAGALTYYALAVRPWLLHWGTTADETTSPLPCDNLVAEAVYVTTRAVTVQAPAEAIWPWLVQMGQGRAGFYTYDRLEQIVGAAIRSADRILPELQQLAVGDTVPLSTVGGPKVAFLDPGRGLVLSGTMDLRTARSIPTIPATWSAMDWTWSFALRPMRDGTTRLLVRTRGAYRPRRLLAPVVPLLLEPIHFVMERGMLWGIKRRAERTAASPSYNVRPEPSHLHPRLPRTRTGRESSL